MRGCETPGAVDVTARYRPGPRLVRHEGSTYLLPTVVLCDSPDHPLANREFLFPFAAVVPLTADEMLRVPIPLGKTLVLTALTRRSRADRPAAGVAARRSAQRGRNSDEPDQLGPAARGQPVRAPICSSLVPDD